MILVWRSISIASPKVLVRKRIFFPSRDQSARSPNHVTWVIWGGKWLAGFSPDSAAAKVEPVPKANAATTNRRKALSAALTTNRTQEHRNRLLTPAEVSCCIPETFVRSSTEEVRET